MNAAAVIDQAARRRTSIALAALTGLLAAAAWVVHPVASLLVLALGIALASVDWRLPPSALISVYSAVVVLVPSDILLGSGAPVDLSVDRIALAVLLVAWASGVIETEPGEQLATYEERPGRTLMWLLLIALVSLLLNSPRTIPANDLITGAKGVFVLAAYVATYFLVFAIVRTRYQVMHVARAIVGAGALAALFGGLERATGANFIRSAALTLPGFSAHVEHGDIEMVRGGAARVFGSAEHPIAFGGALALLLPLALGLAVRTEKRERVFWSACTAAIAGAMLLTVSRSALIASAVAFIVLLVLWPRQRVPLMIAALFGLFAVHMLIPGLLGTFRSILVPDVMIEQQNNPEFSGRIVAVTRARPLIADFMLFGRGFNNFDPHRYFYLDNQVLKFALELGAAGIIAIGAFFGRVVRQATSAARMAREEAPFEASLLASVLAYAVLSFLFDTAGFVQVTSLFIIICALSVRFAQATLEAVRAERR